MGITSRLYRKLDSKQCPMWLVGPLLHSKEVKPSKLAELEGGSGPDDVQRFQQKWGSVETNKA